MVITNGDIARSIQSALEILPTQDVLVSGTTGDNDNDYFNPSMIRISRTAPSPRAFRVS
jgi:hypothetical protein